MPEGATPHDNSGAWSQILFEAREIRNKQDARLASAQRQSQLIVAGFLAMTAIFLTAMSIYVASRHQTTAEPVFTAPLTYTEPLAVIGALAFTAVGLLNGIAWAFSHRIARHWKEVPEFDQFMDLPGRVDALVRLRRRLVITLLDHYDANERIVRWAQRLAGAQGAITLLFVYFLSSVWLVL